MTDFTNLATLVAQGQSLLDLVKGGHITQLEANNAAKLSEVDAALAAKIAQANTDIVNAIAPINNKIPRIQLTQNQELRISTGTVPDNMMVSSGVTLEHIIYIGKGVARDAGVLSMLNGIKVDIAEQFADFNIRETGIHSLSWSVVRLSWDFGAEFIGDNWLAFMESALKNIDTVPKVAELTSAAFVKLESGSISGDWATGAETGKWRFCKQVLLDENFGGYYTNHPKATSQTGSLLLALPVVATGVIDHPNKLFKNLELG
jgi:hypothetical protein